MMSLRKLRISVKDIYEYENHAGDMTYPNVSNFIEFQGLPV